ncbi:MULTISPECIES: hypothetical protein [unclassified Burkholderia]|uniref:hypothetical protein n=1 Tax=unclassified Burkholderia TaxID=2613784 RepID=UPI0015890373|nr:MULTISPECIES: hypothetical protein [unclassified Burkholderia]
MQPLFAPRRRRADRATAVLILIINRARQFYQKGIINRRQLLRRHRPGNEFMPVSFASRPSRKRLGVFARMPRANQ